MTQADLQEFISFCIGTFGLGYVGGHLLMIFKKALGIVK